MANEEKRNFTGYIIFWLGQLASMAGSNVVGFGLTWWITVETESAFFLGLAASLGFGSFIAALPIAGVLVDRWSRKKIIAISDSLLAGSMLLLLLLFATGQATIWHVLMLRPIQGVLGAFHQNAVDAIVPLMVPKKRLSRMNGLQYLATSLINTLGPAAGALVYTLLAGDMAKILWIDIGTYLIAIVPTILVFIPVIKAKKERGEKSSFKAEFGEGLTFIRETPGLLTLLSVFTVGNFLLTPLFVLLPLFTTNVVALGDENIAVIMLATLMFLQNLSMVSASMFMSFWKGFKRNVVGVVLGLSCGAFGVFILGVAPAGVLWVAVLGILLVGLTIPIANVASQTIWQSVVPPEKIGRVFSVRQTIAQFTGPIAMFLCGIVAEFFGTQIVFLGSGLLMISFLIFAWVFTGLSHVEESIKTKTEERIDDPSETEGVTPTFSSEERTPAGIEE
ncbi:MAG: MFS transporter [Candidatus Hodarchaeota archaeon]